MHKFTVIVLVSSLITVGQLMASERAPDIGGGPLDSITAREMSQQEMEDTDGALHARGTSVSLRMNRTSWGNRPTTRSRPYCDIVARNRAESLGFDTSSPQGRFSDYNRVNVAQIYDSFGSRGTSFPRPGTAGYIFTGSADRKNHLQFYDYRGRGTRYTRYSNSSTFSSESAWQASPSYRPTSVTRQRFVPLPRRNHRTIWSR